MKINHRGWHDEGLSTIMNATEMRRKCSSLNTIILFYFFFFQFLSKQNSKSSRQHSADDESHGSDGQYQYLWHMSYLLI